MESKPKSSEFARTKLPWIVAGAMFVIYLATINQWVSIRSLPVIAKITGWDWTPPTQWPLYYLITYPFRFLPATLQPVALNFFSLVCACLTIALLVRSVTLLPHDRTDEQRIRQRSHNGLLSSSFAWPPAVLAAAVLGLELTMWEHATSATSEALDLLVFAYLIRCLLEYRISENEKWLGKLAFVYGLGVTNNWALIGFFPFFLAALIWIRGKAFFKLAFMARMAALGLAGMLLYLLIPLIWVVKGEEQIGFWQSLHQLLISQKMILFNVPTLRARALILSLTSIVPVIILGIKFPSGFGDVHSAGSAITDSVFRFIHLFFAVACIWVSFDQQFSPRALGMGLSFLTFLTFYYLGALAVGYFVGYLMLVHTDPPKKAYRSASPLSKLINPTVRAAAWAAVALIPLALLYKNFKIARSENGKLLADFAESVASQIPDKPAILLSDDYNQLGLMEAWYAKAGGNPHILINPRSLPYPAYHRELVRRYGNRWPSGGAEESVKIRIEPISIASTLASMAVSNAMYYLHPSYGILFEAVYGLPHGLVTELKRYPTNVIFPPDLTAEMAQTNRQYWKNYESLTRRTEALSPFKTIDASFVELHLARGLNKWGVDLQRIDQFSEAEPIFELALSINTNNLPAEVNLAFNRSRNTGKRYLPEGAKSMEDLLGLYRGWDPLLAENGPVDVPEYLYGEGQMFLQQNYVRQAVDCFARSAKLVPTNSAPRMALASAMIRAHWIDQAREVIAGLKIDTNITRPQKLDLIAMEAAVQFAQHDSNRAEATLQKAIQDYPSESSVFFDSLNEMYLASGLWAKSYDLLARQIALSPTNIPLRVQQIELAINSGNTNAVQEDLKALESLAPGNVDASMFRIFLAIQEKDYKKGLAEVEKILQLNEKNVQALIYQGILRMELKEDDRAIESLDAALKIDPNSVSAMRNRALANLRAERLGDAKKDYESLLGVMPRSHSIYYGLGEVAYKQKDKAEALRNYELYLKYVPKQGTPGLDAERKRIGELVKELKTASK